MIRSLIRTFAIAGASLAVILAASPAFADPVEATFSGMTMDAEDLGLGGVQVKVFVDGYLKGSAVSGADGSFDTTFRYDELGDQTIVAWFVPQQGYVPEVVVLRESSASKELGLWSPCLPRVDVSASVSYDATIYDEKSKFAALGEQDCF